VGRFCLNVLRISHTKFVVEETTKRQPQAFSSLICRLRNPVRLVYHWTMCFVVRLADTCQRQNRRFASRRNLDRVIYQAAEVVIDHDFSVARLVVVSCELLDDRAVLFHRRLDPTIIDGGPGQRLGID
jgi:hypothetical protein